MTLTIPEAFPKWLVEAVAGYWPDCDEDALRREGDHWKAAADSCRQLGKRHNVAAATEKAALHGYSADTKATRNVQLGDDLCNHAEYFDSMAEQCHKKANDCEFTKLQVIGTGLALLAQLAADALMSAPGVIKAAEDRAAAEASWAASARRYYGSIKKVGLECATKRKGLPLAKATAIGFALGAGTAAEVNAGAQFYQKEILHHRDKMEWDLVQDAAIIGGVGGGIGARFASRFAPGINKFLGKVAGKSESNIVRYSTHVTAGVLIGGVGGLAGAISGAGAGIVVTGHIPDSDELRAAVIQGLVGGFVGSATIFARPLPPGMGVQAKTDTSNTNTSTTPPSTQPSGSGTHSGTTPPPDAPPRGATPPGGSDPAPRIPREPTPPEPGTPRNGQGDDTRRPADDPNDGPLPDPPPTNTPEPDRPQPEPTRPKPDEPKQPPQVPQRAKPHHPTTNPNPHRQNPTNQSNPHRYPQRAKPHHPNPAHDATAKATTHADPQTTPTTDPYPTHRPPIHPSPTDPNPNPHGRNPTNQSNPHRYPQRAKPHHPTTKATATHPSPESPAHTTARTPTPPGPTPNLAPHHDIPRGRNHRIQPHRAKAWRTEVVPRPSPPPTALQPIPRGPKASIPVATMCRRT
ncbi:hypothetical protein [Nocardia sp. NPDC049707]|uniref:WXG100-like domain-containing protein n=1 Tax=Nocardia sp. NPDC049707 TaxID=3154735 RepID=UPI0034449635